jgi:enolase
VRASAQTPSGASRGAAEALELRDGDPARHRGLGCRKAAEKVRGPILSALKDRSFESQEALDAALIELDGSGNKSRLGANAILGVSLAFARAHARRLGIPLFEHFARMIGEPLRQIPRPTINLFSGGKHAGGQVSVQDVLVAPTGAASVDDALAVTCAVYHAAADLAREKYSARALVADEGGLAPGFASSEAMLQDAVEAIERAGLQPGRDVALAIDVAASHFFDGRNYKLEGETLSSDGMILRLERWLDRFPLISVEDGLAEEDWEGWTRLAARLGGRALILGDDLLCTHPGRIERAANARAASALLLKVNQVGTLTEAATALRRARAAGWHVTISARSGETEDTWLADLAVGWGGDHIKIGSVTRSERLAKYNRLLAIERETRLPLAGAGART